MSVQLFYVKDEVNNQMFPIFNNVFLTNFDIETPHFFCLSYGLLVISVHSVHANSKKIKNNNFNLILQNFKKYKEKLQDSATSCNFVPMKRRIRTYSDKTNQNIGGIL